MDPRVEQLRGQPCFRDLDEAQLEQVALRTAMRPLAAGELLALEGEPCRAVYLVVAGHLQALKMSLEGREQIVGQLLPGELLYVVPALDGGPLPATARAACDSLLLSFSRADFCHVLARYPSVSMHLLVQFARRLRQLSTLVEDLALRTVSQRLARLLVNWAESPNRRRMTQREMAAQLGTVREVVARTLAQFEAEGWIAMHRGTIEVLDLPALRDAGA